MTRLTAMAPAPSMTPWSAGINLAGALAVGWGLWRVAPGVAGWVLALVIVGLVAWIIRVVLAVLTGSVRCIGRGEQTWRAVGAVLLLVMVITGGLTAIPTQGLGVAVLMIAVLVIGSDPAVSPVAAGVVVLVGVLCIAAGALLVYAGLAGSAGESMDIAGFLAVLAGLSLAVAGGLGRRGQRVLLAERERASAEAVRAEAAAHRIAIARDLHDVLAHSLGGLVVQLDAVEALLDAGDADRAADRVAAARRLAVEGLDEARTAVRTLRAPDEEHGSGTGAAVLPAEFETRVRASLAGVDDVRLDLTGAPRPLPAAVAEALVRAVQEGLSNARKHAPGSGVHIGIVWHPDRVECTIENPIRPVAPRGERVVLAATGGGYGLRGIRERIEALGGTMQAGAVRGPSRDSGPSTGSGGGGTGSGADAGDLFLLRVEAPA